MSPTEHVALAPYCTLRLGGPAHWFARVETIEQLRTALAWSTDRKLDPLVLGGGSNLVVADAGWPGLVVQFASRGVEYRDDGELTRVTAAAGEPWDALVAATVERGLAGLECLSGIPGCVGGTPIQNVGAYGQEVAEVIESVTVLERKSGRVQRISGAECGFGYRQSRFKHADSGRFVVLEVAFLLRPGGEPTLHYPALIAELGGAKPTLAGTRAAVLAVRKRKGMVLDDTDPDTRSVGSFFMNPVVAAAEHALLRDDAGQPAPSFAASPGRLKVPAAWLIERAGFKKGHAQGPVGISTKHPLALINRGGATAREVVAFACAIQRAVADRFGITLRAEPEFVGFGTNADVAALRSG